MEASVTGLFRVLLILFIVYYVFKLLVRFVFPYIVKNYLNKAQQRFYEANPHLDPEPKKTGKEGEVKVKTKPSNQQDSKPKDFGEYVDYEEYKE